MCFLVFGRRFGSQSDVRLANLQMDARGDASLCANRHSHRPQRANNRRVSAATANERALEESRSSGAKSRRYAALYSRRDCRGVLYLQHTGGNQFTVYKRGDKRARRLSSFSRGRQFARGDRCSSRAYECLNKIYASNPQFQITNHAAQFYIFCVCSTDYRTAFRAAFPCFQASRLLERHAARRQKK